MRRPGGELILVIITRATCNRIKSYLNRISLAPHYGITFILVPYSSLYAPCASRIREPSLSNDKPLLRITVAIMSRRVP